MAIISSTDQATPFPRLTTTPLIDIMLVLLVMFIITIPLQTHAVKLVLPGPSLPQPRSSFNTISVAPSADIGWNGGLVDLATLRRYLDMTRTMTPEPELPIAADRFARYACVDEMLAVVQRSGVRKVGFVDNERCAHFENRSVAFALPVACPFGCADLCSRHR